MGLDPFTGFTRWKGKGKMESKKDDNEGDKGNRKRRKKQSKKKDNEGPPIMASGVSILTRDTSEDAIPPPPLPASKPPHPPTIVPPPRLPPPSLYQPVNSMSVSNRVRPPPPPPTTSTTTSTGVIKMPVSLASKANFTASILSIDSVLPILVENTEFTCVSVVGMRGSGKTTLLNSLLPSKHKGFDDTKATEGMDVIVTADRLILIDTPPVLDIYGGLKGEGGVKVSRDLDLNRIELVSLHLVMYLLCTCHIVVVVVDRHTDVDMFNLFNTAEMLLQVTPSCSITEGHVAQILFVYNKVPRGCGLIKSEMVKFRASLCHFFTPSSLCAVPPPPPSLPSSSANTQPVCPVRYTHLPYRQDTDIDYDYIDAVSEFKSSILSLRRSNSFDNGNKGGSTTSSRSVITETMWLKNAGKVWERIKKSDVYMQYTDILNT